MARRSTLSKWRPGFQCSLSAAMTSSKSSLMPKKPAQDSLPGRIDASNSAILIPLISVRLLMSSVVFIPPITKPVLGSSFGLIDQRQAVNGPFREGVGRSRCYAVFYFTRREREVLDGQPVLRRLVLARTARCPRPPRG